MAVTDQPPRPPTDHSINSFFNTIRFFLFALGGVSMITLFQNCGVNLDYSTPGAGSSCLPTAAQLTTFQPIMTNILQAQGAVGSDPIGCGTCHEAGGQGYGALSVLSGTDQISLAANFCSAVSHGANLAIEPTTSTHPHVYKPADIQALTTWVNSH